MRIISGRLYVKATHPGISGFVRWHEYELAVVSAVAARRCRRDILGEYLPTTEDRFRLEDGHLPEYQPRAGAHDAMAWLADNPFQRAVAVSKPVPDRIEGTVHWDGDDTLSDLLAPRPSE